MNTIRIRLSGDDADITTVMHALTVAGLEVRFSDRTYPNRGGYGIRIYGEITSAIHRDPGS